MSPYLPKGPKLLRLALGAGCCPRTAERAYAGRKVSPYILERIAQAAAAQGLPLPPGAAAEKVAAAS